MATRAQKVQLGVFLAVTTVLFAATVIVLTGAQFWEQRHAYTIRFQESVSGLEVGAPVKFRGVRVGGVTSIRISPDNVEEVEVRISVEPHTPIKVDTEAQVVGQGITGLKFIELLSGTAEAELLPPNSEIPSRVSMIEQLTGRATDMSLKAEQLINNLLMMTRPENQERVDSILANTDATLANLNRLTEEVVLTTALVRQVVEENRGPLKGAVANFERTSREVPELLGQLNQTVVQINTLVARMALPELVAELRQTNSLAQARLQELDLTEAVDRVSAALHTTQLLLENLSRTMNQNQDQLRATLHNLRRASESLREFGRTVQDRPSRLLFDDNPPERKLP